MQNISKLQESFFILTAICNSSPLIICICKNSNTPGIYQDIPFCFLVVFVMLLFDLSLHLGISDNNISGYRFTACTDKGTGYSRKPAARYPILSVCMLNYGYYIKCSASSSLSGVAHFNHVPFPKRGALALCFARELPRRPAWNHPG